MNYSSAWFEPGASNGGLFAAQQAKMRRALGELRRGRELGHPAGEVNRGPEPETFGRQRWVGEDVADIAQPVVLVMDDLFAHRGLADCRRRHAGRGSIGVAGAAEEA